MYYPAVLSWASCIIYPAWVLVASLDQLRDFALQVICSRLMLVARVCSKLEYGDGENDWSWRWFP